LEIFSKYFNPNYTVEIDVTKSVNTDDNPDHIENSKDNENSVKIIKNLFESCE